MPLPRTQSREHLWWALCDSRRALNLSVGQILSSPLLYPAMMNLSIACYMRTFDIIPRLNSSRWRNPHTVYSTKNLTLQKEPKSMRHVCSTYYMYVVLAWLFGWVIWTLRLSRGFSMLCGAGQLFEYTRAAPSPRFRSKLTSPRNFTPEWRIRDHSMAEGTELPNFWPQRNGWRVSQVNSSKAPGSPFHHKKMPPSPGHLRTLNWVAPTHFGFSPKLLNAQWASLSPGTLILNWINFLSSFGRRMAVQVNRTL